MQEIGGGGVKLRVPGREVNIVCVTRGHGSTSHSTEVSPNSISLSLTAADPMFSHILFIIKKIEVENVVFVEGQIHQRYLKQSETCFWH